MLGSAAFVSMDNFSRESKLSSNGHFLASSGGRAVSVSGATVPSSGRLSALPSARVTAWNIEDLDSVPYPENIVEEGETKEVEEPEGISLIVEEEAKKPLRINTTVKVSPLSPGFRRRRPDPPDLSGARKPALRSALITVRNIEHLDSVLYPEGIHGPKPGLNQNAQKGKFR